MKVIFKTDLSYLLTLVFVSLNLVFVHLLFSCFDLLFLLVLDLCLAREFTCCHIRNVIRLALSDVSFLQVVVFVVLELTFVLWYRLLYSVRKTKRLRRSDKIYNRNSSGPLTQTCPALAIKTATILELVGEVEKIRGEVE